MAHFSESTNIICHGYILGVFPYNTNYYIFLKLSLVWVVGYLFSKKKVTSNHGTNAVDVSPASFSEDPRAKTRVAVMEFDGSQIKRESCFEFV